jgi:hypothetical protein
MEASIFAESIKRLYTDGFIDKDKVLELYKNGALTVDEVNFVLDNAQ